MRGPFGGWGGYVKQQAGLRSDQIPTVIEGKPAEEIRAIVYASGCEIQTCTIPLTFDSETKPQFGCKHITTATNRSAGVSPRR
jgi:hypothetical protein